MNSPHPDHYFSTEVREIMGKPLKNTTLGITILTGVVVILTLVGWFSTYPDKVMGSITLTTAEPPVTIIAPSTGHLAQIRVKDGLKVKRNDILAVFLTTAETDDILKLEKQVDELSNFELSSISNYAPDPNLNLGELTPFYTGFLTAFQNLPFVKNNAADQAALAVEYGKVRTLQKSAESLGSQKTKLMEKMDAAQRVFNLIKYEYEQTSDTKYASEMNKANKDIKQIALEMEELDGEISRAKNDILDQKAGTFELTVLQQAGAKDRINQMKQSLSSLKSEIQQWKEKNLVLSPSDGEVAFNAGLAEKQLIDKDDELMFIVPETTKTAYVGEVKIAPEGSGKVKTGQQVSISFDRFPFRQFGKVKGKVEKVFTLPQEDGYLVRVSLPNGLNTTLGKTLDFQQKMTGTVEISTDERRFISRLFDNVRFNG